MTREHSAPQATGRVICHLDMNAFFASVEQRANPALRGRPVVVTGNRHARTVVATASYEARAQGVATGMALGEARRLCPNAVVVEGTPIKYGEAFAEVVPCMERYTPAVEIFSIDEAFMDVTATHDRFGGPARLAHRLQREVAARTRLPCSVGTAPNKLLAKLASGLRKPNGVTVLSPDAIPALLEDLPVTELCGIGPHLGEALAVCGLTTCGQLAAVERAWLLDRFGPAWGHALHRMARGLDETPVVPSDRVAAVKSMGHLHTLPRDSGDPQRLRAVLLMLSEKVGRRLRAEGYSGRTVTVTARARDMETVSRQQSGSAFVSDGREIYALACRVVARHRLFDQPVRALGVAVSGLRQHVREGSLLEEERRRERLVTALDRINDRYGEFVVMPALLMAYGRPAEHYQLRSSTVGSSALDRVGSDPGSDPRSAYARQGSRL